jgi:hypothetical protein
MKWPIPFCLLMMAHFAQSNPCDQLPPAGSPSRLYRDGSVLCWNGAPIRMIGYGSIDLATRDGYNSARFLNTLRFSEEGSVKKNHGVNLTRIWVTGAANNPDCFHTPVEEDPRQPPTTMPFQYLPEESCSANHLHPKYNMCISSIACSQAVGLNPVYVSRLQNILTEARNNGILVELVLFDAYFLGRGHSDDPLYATNPWNPLNNNMGQNLFRRAAGSQALAACNRLYRSTDESDIAGDVFPEFYDICKDSITTARCDQTLNCLGLIQKAYVQSIVDLVKNNVGGSDNVFFEIMNRATFDKTDTKQEGFDLAKFKRWNDVVGHWIKCRGDNNCNNTRGDYLVMGEVGLIPYTDIACSNRASCPNNPSAVFAVPNIDMINIQGATWENSPDAPGPCQTATTAVSKFHKPVIIDTDSAYQRVNKCKLAQWASQIKACGNPGEVHLNQLDGMTFGYPSPKLCSFTGTGTPKLFEDFDEKYLDCFALDILAFGAPTFLSDIVTTDVPASCPHSVAADGSPTWCAAGCKQN